MQYYILFIIIIDDVREYQNNKIHETYLSKEIVSFETNCYFQR